MWAWGLVREQPRPLCPGGDKEAWAAHLSALPRLSGVHLCDQVLISRCLPEGRSWKINTNQGSFLGSWNYLAGISEQVQGYFGPAITVCRGGSIDSSQETRQQPKESQLWGAASSSFCLCCRRQQSVLALVAVAQPLNHRSGRLSNWCNDRSSVSWSEQELTCRIKFIALSWEFKALLCKYIHTISTPNTDTSPTFSTRTFLASQGMSSF